MGEPTTPVGHSSSSSASFRESDIEFLRAQAREWLEAVLNEDLDDHTSLEDLLADGTLLYRVAQHIKDDDRFPGHGESSSSHLSGTHGGDRKSSLKYQPYPYVEAFLNVCKEVGLKDLDVFNPSDAVDKKDIRRVCVCLRRLSKKGRTIHIQVPDFDNVKDTMSTPVSKMSTEAVARTKETLQHSSTKSSSKSSTNGQVSKETSSSIADLRKDDTDSVSLKPTVKVETYNKVHHDLDVAAERRKPVDTDSKYEVKVAEPGVDTLRLADHDHVSHDNVSLDHVDRKSGESSANSGSVVIEGTHEVHTATAPLSQLPLKSSVQDKPQGKPQEKPEEKPQEQPKPKPITGENQKGHLIAKPDIDSDKRKSAPREEVKKDEKKGGFPWLPLLGGAAAIAGGIVVAIYLKKRNPDAGQKFKEIIEDGDDRVKEIIERDEHQVVELMESGKLRVRQLAGRGDHSDSYSDDDNHSSITLASHSGGLYEVKQGDNLTKIAKKAGKKHWSEITDKNSSINNPDLIYPGDRLNL